MSIAQILNLNTGQISNSSVPEDLEVNRLSFSGGEENSVRVGVTDDIDGMASVGIAYQSTTSGDHSVAIGHSSASASRGVCVGHSGVVSDEKGVAIGDSANTASGVAIGASSNADESGVSVGADAQAVKHGVAVGHQAHVSGNYGVSIGAETKAGLDAIAIGSAAEAEETDSIAIGHKAKTSYESQLVIKTKGSNDLAPIDTRKGLYTDAIAPVTPTNNDYLVRYNPDRQELFLKKDSNTVFDFGSYVEIIMGQLATEDPQNQGQLWNDDGTMKISAGS